MVSTFRQYLLPGFLFQSVVIAGGYGTGRELAEFFLSHGPLGALLSMSVSTAIWSAVCVVSYEFARVFAAFDYRSFFLALLGRGWFTLEILYIALMIIVLAVIAASAGSIVQGTFQGPYAAGVGGILALVGLLVLGGSRQIERALAGWSAVLYIVYLVFFAMCIRSFGPEIHAAFAGAAIKGNWLRDGFAYAGYNLGVLPATLIAVRHHRNRRDTWIAGLLTGPIAMIPGFLFLVSIAGEYPAIVEVQVPIAHMLELLGSRPVQIVFQVMLFGTLVETGAGLIHAVNQRIAQRWRDGGRVWPAQARALVALAMLGLGAVLAALGLIPLVGVGYRYITWGFLACFVLPVLTRGVVMIRRRTRELAA